jgi:hypothetical protein
MEGKDTSEMADLRRRTYGGYFVDQPSDCKRWFDDKRRRRVVTAKITSWAGSIGKHYYPSLEEEDNPAWDEKEQTWRICWDEPIEHKGRRYGSGERFLSWHAASRWISREFKKRFKGRYKLVLEQSASDKHYYALEGD